MPGADFIDLGGDKNGWSAAARRRKRRLGSWAKHKRLTVAMALTGFLHHSGHRPEWRHRRKRWSSFCKRRRNPKNPHNKRQMRQEDPTAQARIQASIDELLQAQTRGDPDRLAAHLCRRSRSKGSISRRREAEISIVTVNGNLWTTHREWIAHVGPRHLVLAQEQQTNKNTNTVAILAQVPGLVRPGLEPRWCVSHPDRAKVVA